MKELYLNKWVFSYNPYKELFRAALRENYEELFNTNNSNKVIEAHSIQLLFKEIKELEK